MRNKRITIRHRRRREGKTDYKARLKLLSSSLPRLIIRKSNKYIVAQLIESKEAQDYIICSVNSKELSKYGWNNSKKNVPASYLTCFLLVKKCKGKVKKAILDAGLYRSTTGSRIYACLKGAVDAGLQIPYSEEIIPKEERIKGMHINEKIVKDFEQVKQKISEIK
ncbi:MAG: 50S ribosomal protein L18 [Nanoarchaeota archaeon]|nr:50S ribosomal protein L18 [Nanoarchaeota archaeon]